MEDIMKLANFVGAVSCSIKSVALATRKRSYHEASLHVRFKCAACQQSWPSRTIKEL